MESRVIHFEDLKPRCRELMQMPKDVVDGNYAYRWPVAGKKLKVEMMSPDDRRIRFFLDIEEQARRTSVIVSAQIARKTNFQTRAGNTRLIGVHLAENPSVLRHRNPDGGIVEGPHVHLDVEGYDSRFAFPIQAQDVLCPPSGVYSVEEMFMEMIRVCAITKKLEMAFSLGV